MAAPKDTVRKVMTVERVAGTRTERDIEINEFKDMLNGEPGGVSRRTLHKQVKAKKDFTSVGTLPAGAKLVAVGIHFPDDAVGEGSVVNFGTEDSPSSLGSHKAPAEDAEESDWQKSEWKQGDVGDEDKEVGVTLQTDDEYEEVPVCVSVTYDVLNGF